MTVPVQVTFRDMAHSDAVAAHVERRFEKLGHFSDRIVSCHVVVEEPHRHHTHGKRFAAKIDLQVPGKEIVITKLLEESKENMHAAIDDAFDSCERVLEAHVRKQRERRRV